MTAPKPEVCPDCDSEGWLEYGLTVVPVLCEECRCICGGPLGHWCELLDDIDDDRMQVRRSDR